MSVPTPSNSPATGSLFDVTDERLAADLKKGSGKRPAHYPAGELLARHWVAVFSYARLCTNGAQYAGMLTTAAFTRLFGESVRHTGPKAAWRPQLLVTVRRIAGEWDADKRRELLHPELQSGPDGESRAAALLLPPENRRLVTRAFQRLPESTRCVLWHAEVEAEDLAVPAGLLGIAVEDAATELDRARELLRQNCVESHRELAPEETCRRYSRLLDVSIRRGGSIVPDLRQHLAECTHCQYAADQLNQAGGRLAVLLAEGVLGWAARPYLDSRPGRRARVEQAHAGPIVSAVRGAGPSPDSGLHPVTDAFPGADLFPGTGPQPVTGSSWGGGPHPGPGPRPETDPRLETSSRRRTGPRHAVRLPPHADARPAEPGRRFTRRRRNLALAVLAVSGCVLVPLALWSGGGDDDRLPSAAGTGAASENPDGPSRIDAGDSQPGTLSGRLRNTGTEDCVSIADGKATEGAEVILATCTSSERQQWSHESDGVLRSLADSDLCLDSRIDFSVRLGLCEGAEQREGVRYDFTVEGNLVPLEQPKLALAPASGEEGTGLVLRARDDGPSQRWEFDTSVDSLQMEWITSYTNKDTAERIPAARPEPTRTPPSSEPNPKPSEASPTPWPTAPAPAPNWQCYGSYCWQHDGSGGGTGGSGYGGGGYGGGYGGGDYGGGGYGGGGYGGGYGGGGYGGGYGGGGYGGW
ncbi:ricin-type beta-trefoil lectin domain protein [Streptomyces sp. 2A115]|uniref:ricin-type beta-trefoil lectin domain protein n=1 Tax=Streptomyces sp. 2A115 TaxID=3457439 RepID=UPI003FD2A201